MVKMARSLIQSKIERLHFPLAGTFVSRILSQLTFEPSETNIYFSNTPVPGHTFAVNWGGLPARSVLFAVHDRGDSGMGRDQGHLARLKKNCTLPSMGHSWIRPCTKKETLI
jgi:hypothetical protein